MRDEEELNRLREEVRRLQAELAGPRPADDRGLYEARIRELEARLTEAGDPRPATGSAALDAAGTAETDGTGENATGMQIGERRTREGLEPDSAAPAGTPAPEDAPGSGTGIAGSRPAGTGSGLGATGGIRGMPRIEPPQLLRAIRPDYPRVARARRRMATVELKVQVDATGRVLSVEPVGPPAGFGFDESAREAAMSAQFRPGRRDGVAVEMETRLAIRFLLEGPPS